MVQGQRSRSHLWHTAVDIRGSALPSVAKSNKNHYQSKVFVSVPIIRGLIWITVPMCRSALFHTIALLYMG